jgi:hypothetical protein
MNQARLASFIILTVLLVSTGNPAQARRPPDGAHQSAAAPFQVAHANGVLARVVYTDRADLQKLAARLDVWEVHPGQSYLVALLAPAELQALLQEGYRVVIDETRTSALYAPRQAPPGQTSGIPGFPCYRTISETYASAQAVSLAYPNLATWSSIGPTWEKANLPGPAGYDLFVLRLTSGVYLGPKPKLFIMASIHAREYAPAELLTRFAEFLVSHYGSDPDITWLLDYREIHLLLQANPDGRRQAENGLYWRKNTNQAYCPAIPQERGADLNRNYPYQWGLPFDQGSSSDPCAETYRGSSAASEPETQDVINYITAQFPDRRPDDLTSPAPTDTTGLFLDLHSYDGLVLWPWGWTGNAAPNAVALQTLGRKLAFINQYYPEQSDNLYFTDGTTDDFAYGSLGLPAYTFEMGTDFFQDCGTFENVIAPDNLPALVYAAKAAGKPYLEPGGPDAVSLSASPTAVVPGEPVTLTAVIDDNRYSSVNGIEPVQDIAAAEYTIDTPPWITTTAAITHTMAASDGAFDQVSEQVTAAVDTSGLSQGRHILFVRGLDAQGNWGVISAVFLDVNKQTYMPFLGKDTVLSISR